MCLYIDYDDQITLSTGFHKARKPHECWECKRVIDPGESYWFQTSVMESSCTGLASS